MIRKISFIVFILGMIVLLSILNFYFTNLNNLKELDGMEINRKVIVSGEVVGERTISFEKKLLDMDNGIQLVCLGCAESFEGYLIRAEGMVSEYNGKKQIEVLRIESKKN